MGNKGELKYIGNDPNRKDEQFNVQTFNDFRDKKQYQEAYNYAMNFAIVGDIQAQDDWINNLEEMRMYGLREQKLYENVDRSKLDAVDFIDNVLQPGGLEKISDNNAYKQKCIEYKNQLGNGANRLRIEFQSKKQTLFGQDWLDWVVRDNTNQNIDKFYEDNNLSTEYLRQHGVKVFRQDRKDYLEFDKSNDLANTILINLYTTNNGNYPVEIYGITEQLSNDNDLNEWTYDDKNGVYISVSDNKNLKFAYADYTGNIVAKDVPLNKFQQIYSEANNEATIAYDEIQPKTKTSSVRVFPNAFGDLEALRNEYNAGNMKVSEYKLAKQEAILNLLDGIAVSDFSVSDIYTDAFNEDNTVGMHEVTDQKLKRQLQSYMKGAKTTDLKYGLVISNGRVGIQVTIPGIKNKADRITDIDDVWKQEPITFNIYNKDLERGLQNKINNDPNLKAWREIQTIEDIGYGYITTTGDKYEPDGLGGWTINGEVYNGSKEDIHREIQKDMIIKDASRELVLRNSSVKGNIVDKNKFDFEVKYLSLYQATDLTKVDILEELTDLLGNDYKRDWNSAISAIFSLKGSGDKVADEYADKIANPNVYYALNDLFQIYTNIINRTKLYTGE